MILLLLLLFPSMAWATDRYADNTLVSDCTSGNYSISSRNCTGSDGNAYNDFASIIAVTNAGDTIYIRGGTWTEQFNLQDAGKTGTANNWITIAGYPGETVTLRCSASVSGHGCIKARGARGYFIFQDFTLDGINMPLNVGWSLRDGNHHFVLQRLRIINQNYHGVYVDATDITIQDSYIADNRSDCVAGNRHYAIYAHDGARLLVQRNEFTNNPGGGSQIYPGPWNGVQYLNNYIHDTSWCSVAPISPVGGITVGTDNDATAGNITGVVIAGNVISNVNVDNSSGVGAGIRVFNNNSGGVRTVSGVLIHNNVVYHTFNNTSTGSLEYGILLASPASGSAGVTNADVRNNIVIDNGNGQIRNDAGGTNTITHNACKAGDSCGTTGKVTLTAITDCLVDPDNGDFRLKNGTNSCRNVGTSVSTRPSPVGITDIGAYEQPEIASASIDAATMEVLIDTGGQDISPTSGLTGITPACSGHASCGTPAVVSSNVKAGSSVTVQVVISGITGGNCALTQTWVVSLSSANFGAGFVGPTGSDVQGVNDSTDFAVTEICTGSGGTPPTVGLVAHYKFNSSDGTDSSGNGNTATISAGVTFATAYEGMGAVIPTDATFNHVEVTGFGTGRNPSTDSLSKCVVVTPDLQYSQKIIFSSGDYSGSRRWYAGWITIGGQIQWGIGIQGSAFNATGSEFVVTAQPTLVCLRSDADTDTAYLSVNGVTGTIVGKSVKTYTSYTLADDIRTGNDGTFTINNGGFTIDEDRTWDVFLTDQEVLDLYTSLFSDGSSSAGYAQKTHRWQHVYLDDEGNPINYSTSNSINVVAGGAVALEMQVDCTGGDCDSLTAQLWVSNLAGNTIAVPSSVGAFGVGMWGSSVDSDLNKGVSTCCLTGALTGVDGVTMLASSTTNTVDLSEDNSVMFRWLIRFGADAEGETLIFFLKQDNGAALDGEAGTLPRVVVTTPQANGSH